MWVHPISATLQIAINEIINKLNKRVKYEEPCDGRLSSTVPREGRVKVPPLTRLVYMKIGFKNFRRFQDFPMVELGGCTFLVGGNNSGKSTFLKALILLNNNVDDPYQGVLEPLQTEFSFAAKEVEHLYLGDFRSNLNDNAETGNMSFFYENGETLFTYVIDGNSIKKGSSAVQVPLEEFSAYNKKYDINFRWKCQNGMNFEVFECNYNPQKAYEWINSFLSTNRSNQKLTQVTNYNAVLEELEETLKCLEELTDNQSFKVKRFFGPIFKLTLNGEFINAETSEKQRTNIIPYLREVKNAILSDFFNQELETPSYKTSKFRIVDAGDAVQVMSEFDYDIYYSPNPISLKRLGKTVYIEAHNATHKVVLNPEDKNDYLAQTIYRYKDTKDAHEFVTKWMKIFNIGDDFEIHSVYNEAYIVDVLAGSQKKSLGYLGTGSIQIFILLLHISMALEFRSKVAIYIEEPEQNLHPALQSRLADMFYDVWVKSKGKISFVVETHSEYLVRHTQVIAAKEIDNGVFTTDEFNDIMKVYYFPEDGLPYSMGYRQNGHFENQFGTGFYDEAGNSTRELYKIDRGLLK